VKTFQHSPSLSYPSVSQFRRKKELFLCGNLIDACLHSTHSILTHCRLLHTGDAGTASGVVRDHAELEQRQKPASFSISNPAVSALRWCEGVNRIKHVSRSTHKEVPSCSSSNTSTAEAQPDHSPAPTGCLSFSYKAITPAITGCLKYNRSPSSLLSGQSFLMLLLQAFPHHISRVRVSWCIWFQHTEALLRTGPCADCILKYLMEWN